ncbi:MAG: lipid-A-disaccharide synthase [Pseudomonadota bacterium]
MTPPRLFLVAGELSGDRLGGSLMQALRKRAPGVAFFGLGGPLMSAQGLAPLFPISETAVMGLVEVLPRIRRILRRIDETARAAIEADPDALVTIDSPDFGLRVAARFKKARPETPVIHYVAPSVWAWRPGRAKRMARHVDHVLALLPFEPPYMAAAGMGCSFVGHPAVELDRPLPTARAAWRARFGPGPVLCVLPGSRRGEVRRLLPLFGATVAKLARRHAGLAVVVPAALHVVDQVEQGVSDWPCPVTLLDPREASAEAADRRKLAAFAGADAALSASGTVVLELAAMGCPMVAAYRVNHLTSLIIRHIVKVRTANLVNLLTEDDAVPEYLQEYATPDVLAAALDPLLRNGAARDAQIAAQERAMLRIGRGDTSPSDRAAQAVLSVIAQKQPA